MIYSVYTHLYCDSSQSHQGIESVGIHHTLDHLMCYGRKTTSFTRNATSRITTRIAASKHESKAKEGGDQATVPERFHVTTPDKGCWPGRNLLALQDHLVCHFHFGYLPKNVRIFFVSDSLVSVTRIDRILDINSKSISHKCYISHEFCKESHGKLINHFPSLFCLGGT